MRVQYTLPGFVPASTPEKTESGGASFRTRLRALETPHWRNWASVLRLNVPPASGAAIGPPPKPPETDFSEPAAQRLRWKQMLDRHSAAISSDGGSNTRAAQRMLILLRNYQGLEDAVVARHLSESRG